VTWSGGPTLGAWRDEPGQVRRAIHAVPPPANGQAVRVAVSGSHRDPRLGRWLDQLGPHELTHAGSALKFGLIAEGSAHLYPRFGTTMEWDSAAGEAVVEGAGGHVVRLEGEGHHELSEKSRRLDYNKEDLRNPDFLVGAARRD
jgi:3'(2'), 5'-bisphosphate nucleotidase